MKITKLFALVLSLTCLSSLLYAQTDSLLYGTWKLVDIKKEGALADIGLELSMPPPRISEEESESEDKMEKKNNESEMLLHFARDGYADRVFYSNHLKYEFTLNDSTLVVGHKTYTIKSLTEDQLVLHEKDMLINETSTYARSFEPFESIQKIQKVEEFYDSGRPKLEGLMEMGMPNGVWTEWYESGRVKRIRSYSGKFPFLFLEFDEEGNITTKRWFDKDSRQLRVD